MSITHTIIPAAGLGTRMLPAAKAVPKELLPVLDRPTLQYVVEEAVSAGVSEIVFITSRDKPAILQHFSANPTLDARLAATGKSELLASIQQLLAKAKFRSVDQPEQKGLGDAVLRAESVVGDRPFLCQLGDTIFSGDPSPAKQLIDAHARLGTSVIGLEEVPAEKVSRYGIVGGTGLGDGVFKLDTLVEKPSLASAPSRLAIAARYVLSPAIFRCLEQTAPGKGGEIQLTDALRELLKREPIHGVVLKSRRHDIGNPLDWLRTNLLFASRDAKLWQELSPMLRSLLDSRD